MHSALQQRQEALKEKLKEKTEELRLLCLREGELTGSLPPEYPHTPGQPPPVVRKRVGTSFALDENLINKIINKQVIYSNIKLILFEISSGCEDLLEANLNFIVVMLFCLEFLHVFFKHLYSMKYIIFL